MRPFQCQALSGLNGCNCTLTTESLTEAWFFVNGVAALTFDFSFRYILYTDLFVSSLSTHPSGTVLAQCSIPHCPIIATVCLCFLSPFSTPQPEFLGLLC